MTSADRTGVWGALPDYNGDGFMDVAIGAVPPGGVRVFFGGPGGLAATPDQVLDGCQPSLGRELTPAGDVNGDGYVDLAVSGAEPGETVIVYHGGPQGLTAGKAVNGGGPSFGFAANLALAARAMSAAGDVNGDGYADLLIGDSARGHLFLGGPSGIDPVEVPDLIMPDGFVLAGGADFDGDAFPDAVATNPFRGTGTSFIQVSNDFFFGGAFVGDFNGDGLADFASLLPPTVVGGALVFAGGSIAIGSP